MDMTENTKDSTAKKGISRLFDVRLVIGGVLVVYGVVLTITGLFDGKGAVAKAAGIRINLWTGIGMLVVGVFFLGWMKVLPLAAVSPDDSADDLEKPPDAGGRNDN
jgi:xanthine/uracil/vitamin C permease (AzgA family)